MDPWDSKRFSISLVRTLEKSWQDRKAVINLRSLLCRSYGRDWFEAH
jgi:hypothetical protein